VTVSVRKGQQRVEHQNSDRETPAEWDPETKNIMVDMEMTEAERITEEMTAEMERIPEETEKTEETDVETEETGVETENKIEEMAETTAETERRWTQRWRRLQICTKITLTHVKRMARQFCTCYKRI
jgi:hypothetical protein